MSEQNNIESIFKNAFDQYEVDPGTNAWSSIQAGIGSQSAAAASGTVMSSWTSTAIVGIAISAAAVGGYLYFDDKGAEKKKVAFEEQSLIEQENQIQIEDSKEAKIFEEEERDDIQPESNTKAIIANKDKELSKKKEIVESQKTTDIEVKGQEVSSDTEKVELNSTIPSEKSQSSKVEKKTVATSSEISDNVSDNEANTTTDENAEENNKLKEIETGSQNRDEYTSELTEEQQIQNELKSIVIPNIFTPNQDGTNDLFEVNSEELDNLEVAIYNKTGKLIHEWTGLYGKWDGNLADGSLAPQGIYVYQILLEKSGERIPRKGTITLNR